MKYFECKRLELLTGAYQEPNVYHETIDLSRTLDIFRRESLTSFPESRRTIR